jgi:cytoskeleton protein RodZ
MSEGVGTQDSSLNSNLTSEHLDGNSLRVAGQMLRQARIDAGLHIAALAVTLKVPVKRLEALEDGNQALLPDMVFVRALASSVCRTLKVDAALILEKLPRAELPRLNNDDGSINMPLRLHTSSAKLPLLDVLKAPWLIGVLLLIVGAALIYFWPKSQSSNLFDVGAVLKNTPFTGSNSSTDAGAKQLLETISPRPFSTTSENAAVLVAAPGKELVATADASLLSGSGVADPASTFQLVAANTTVPANSVVVFRATGQTWVEVKSVNGITILKKLLNDGESAGAAGTLPLTVIVGRADVTQVEVRGKPIDLAAIAKSNVARFEVN